MAVTQVREIPAATRLEHVRYAIRDLAVLADEVAKSGKPMLLLNIGDPLKFDFQTPPHMVEAVARAMREGKNGYAPSSGTPEALRAIRAEAGRKGIRNLLDVFVTSGVSEAVDVCFNALLNPGENVLCPSPEYPLYTAVVAKMGLEANSYELDEVNGWEPDLNDIRRKINPRTRGLVFINPNNPTGAVYSRRTLEGIVEIARQHNLVVFADEIYEKLLLEGKHETFAALAPDLPVVTFGGISKNYLAPGWRIGWGIASGPETAMRPYVEGINKLLRARLCASYPMMCAIQPALEGPQTHIAEAVSKLKRRRDLVVEWAQATPRVSCVPPRGAFYAFPRIDIPEPDEEFVKKLLVEKQVLVVHGSGFGQKPGTQHFRIVFLPDEATLGRAFRGIADFMQEHYR
ncbi:MAG TPA: aminotransferase class I/II-fold pyridoxal phosphate-dependent enzyme [Terriglobales bacterium]|jgi:alanine-synthesizing transaminase|nr:aminotransferase class I/II-fold pyridoxal phosphate-dependent enzyme [Terriglobales bacterium]